MVKCVGRSRARMFFMLREWWLNVVDSVLKRGRYASKARPYASINGEELSRCFTNRSETSAFYSVKVELRTQMQWAYLSTRARRISRLYSAARRGQDVIFLFVFRSKTRLLKSLGAVRNFVLRERMTT